MRVLQITKRCVTLLATACVALTGCGGSGPEVPFNPAGTSADIAAVNATFESPAFASFSSFSPLFDAALGGAPLVSASASAFNFRRATNGGELRAAAVRSARRLAALTATANGSFSASTATIPAAIAGKTFEYSGGAYAATARTGAPTNGVRFILYAVDPVTLIPVGPPLVETGYVELTDLSGSGVQAARVVVVSGETTYLDYTVSVTSTASSGRVTVAGFATDGNHRANINLRSTVTAAAGLTLLYTVDVPQRGVSIDLTMTATGLDPQTGTIGIDLGMSGPNGTVSMSGTFTETGGTLTVRVNGEVFATITSASAGDPTITGADGQPLTDQDAEALRGIFEITGQALISFDEMIVPVGTFLDPAA